MTIFRMLRIALLLSNRPKSLENRPHVRTWGETEQASGCFKRSLFDLFGLIRRRVRIGHPRRRFEAIRSDPFGGLGRPTVEAKSRPKLLIGGHVDGDCVRGVSI